MAKILYQTDKHENKIADSKLDYSNNMHFFPSLMNTLLFPAPHFHCYLSVCRLRHGGETVTGNQKERLPHHSWQATEVWLQIMLDYRARHMSNFFTCPTSKIIHFYDRLVHVYRRELCSDALDPIKVVFSVNPFGISLWFSARLW